MPFINPQAAPPAGSSSDAMVDAVWECHADPARRNLRRCTTGYPPNYFDPTGRSGEPPAPLKKEFKPPTPVPLPTLPVIPVPPEGEVKKPLGQIQVFATSIHVIGNTAFSDAELADSHHALHQSNVDD